MTQDTTHQDEPGAPRAQLGFGRSPARDPVDAAIERHRVAREGLERAAKGIDAVMTASQHAKARADAALGAASDADGAAWADLIATRPADVPGAVRLLRYVSDSPATEILDDPQDLLRQLTAIVEAEEAGGEQGATATARPVLAVEPDPALAAAAEYRTAWDALGAAIEVVGGVGVPEVPEAEAADSAAYARLRAVRPTTPAGFRALAETWAWRIQAERGTVEDGEPGATASHAAASLIAGAGACVPLATDAPVSPVLLDLIARHRTLLRRSEADGLSDAEADPLFDEAWGAFRQACSFPIAGVADLAAKLNLMAPEITEGVERGRTNTAEHAWRCLCADLMRPGALAALSSGAAWGGTIAGGLHHPDGTVTYQDAAGCSHRKSVAHWIAFVAFQLHCRAQIEMTRRREGYGDLPGAEIDRLEAEARRELRLDAVSELAFRPDRLFLEAEALRTGVSPSEPGVSADPVLALIEAHRVAYDVWDRHAKAYDGIVPGASGHDAAGTDERASGQRERAAYDALFRARPTTLAGVLAFAEYLGEAVPKVTTHVGETEGDRALAAVTAALRGLDGAASHPDARLLALGAEFMAAWVEEARAKTTEAYNAVSAVAARIALAPAETVAGYGIKALVLARLFSEGSSPLAPEAVPPRGPVYSVWRMLRQVQEGAARLAGVSVEAPGTDAGAADPLADRILTTWAAYAAAEEASDDNASEALLERRMALIGEAERLPAERQHLVAKALALAWIAYADHWETSLSREDHATDGRLAHDIHAIARVPAAHASHGGARPEHDLAGLPLAQLVHLYEALEPFVDPIGRSENAPCFWNTDRTERTAAGDIIYQEAARLDRLLRNIAREIERRQPADDDERDERLRVLIRRAAALDGLTTDRALLTEALAACEK